MVDNNMDKKETFFVNIFPMNDRRDEMNFKAVADEVVQFSVDMCFKYTLVTVGDKRLDPWMVSQYCMAKNDKFNPLIAVNPFYQHPIDIVKKVVALDKMFSNKVALNFVTGSFFGELKAVTDKLSFEERGNRLKEFFHLVQSLLIAKKPVTFQGQYYHLDSADVYPKFSKNSFESFVSGALLNEFKDQKDAFFVKSIRPLDQMSSANAQHCGLGLGICARNTKEEAIAVANHLFPEDRRGEMLFGFSIANNETPWNKWLKDYLKDGKEDYSFFLRPLKNFWSSTPYIVGSYQEVAEKIKQYSDLGYSFFVLDFLPEEATHVQHCLEIFRNL